jgi:hypothetical protein
MPIRLLWTAPLDAHLRRLRQQGATWDQIAAALGVSRYAAIERGRRIGAQTPPPLPRAQPQENLLDPAREPLKAGHAVTWNAITAGTCLADCRYPWPPIPAAAEPRAPTASPGLPR